MEEETWICPECMDKYEIEEARTFKIGAGPFVSDSKMGICPMCSEYRRLIKAKVKQTEKQEGIECLPLTH